MQTAVFDGLKHLANFHVGKEYIGSVNEAIEQLNKDYDKAISNPPSSCIEIYTSTRWVILSFSGC